MKKNDSYALNDTIGADKKEKKAPRKAVSTMHMYMF